MIEGDRRRTSPCVEVGAIEQRPKMVQSYVREWEVILEWVLELGLAPRLRGVRGDWANEVITVKQGAMVWTGSIC